MKTRNKTEMETDTLLNIDCYVNLLICATSWTSNHRFIFQKYFKQEIVFKKDKATLHVISKKMLRHSNYSI